MKQASFAITEDLAEALAARAAREDRSKSSILRTALKQYLERQSEDHDAER